MRKISESGNKEMQQECTDFVGARTRSVSVVSLW